MNKHKNIYVYFEHENYQYKNVEAIDDADHRFEFVFTETEHEKYIEQAKKMCDLFEIFATKECGFDDTVKCDVWFLDAVEAPVPFDFKYESLFDESTICDKEVYERNEKILSGYRRYNLDDLIGEADWCCGQCVETAYIIRNTFSKDAISFEEFYKYHTEGKTGAYAVKAVMQAYKRIIDKDFFLPYEIENTVKFLKDEELKEYRKARSEDVREKLIALHKKERALLRLYEHDRPRFHKFIHRYLHSLNRAHERLDSDFYDLIFNMVYEYYDNRDFEGYEEYPLMDMEITNTLATKDDLRELHTALLRHEGKKMHEGFWLREMPDEYVIDEIISYYKTDSIMTGSMYILPDGQMLFIEEGHHVLGEYLYEKGFEKDYKIGQSSKYLHTLGWIKANTKLKYIDLKEIKATQEQLKKIEELKKFMGTDYQIITE